MVEKLRTKPGGDRLRVLVDDFADAAPEMVDAFHRAALEGGLTDTEPPRVREEYSPRYYATFVRDPHGNNVEAYYRAPDPDG